MQSPAECQINIVLAMSYFCSFTPKFTFPGCSEEFLFPSTKTQNIYHIDNQLVIFFLKIYFVTIPIYRLSDELDTLLFGGPSGKFLRTSLYLQNDSNQLIFNGLEANMRCNEIF